MEENEIWTTLNRDLFFIKNAVKGHQFKLADKLDLFDPEKQAVIMECREPEIGGLEKISRAVGGSHDASAGFDFMVNLIPGNQQALRMSRESVTFTLMGGSTSFEDHHGKKIGDIKRLFTGFGTKLEFTSNASKESFVLKWKCNLLGNKAQVLLDDKLVARVDWNWKGERRDYFKSGEFLYALWIAPEVEKNSRLRQVLLGLGIAQHRIRGSEPRKQAA